MYIALKIFALFTVPSAGSVARHEHLRAGFVAVTVGLVPVPVGPVHVSLVRPGPLVPAGQSEVSITSRDQMPCSDWSLLGLGLEPDPEAGLGVVLGHRELGGGRHEEGLLDAGVDGGQLPVVHPEKIIHLKYLYQRNTFAENNGTETQNVSVYYLLNHIEVESF